MLASTSSWTSCSTGVVRLPAGDVGQPHVVARSGAERAREDQPTAVAADRDAVVAGLVHALAEDHHVVVGRVADPVQVDPVVVHRLVGRHVLGGEPAGVVEPLAAGQPGDGGVAGARQRAVDDRARVDVEHEQRALLVAADGQLVGEQPAFLVGLPAVQRGLAAGVERRRVDEGALGAVGLPYEDGGVLLARGRGARRSSASRARPARRRRRCPAARSGARAAARGPGGRRGRAGQDRPGSRATRRSGRSRRPRASGTGRRRGARTGRRRCPRARRRGRQAGSWEPA